MSRAMRDATETFLPSYVSGRREQQVREAAENVYGEDERDPRILDGWSRSVVAGSDDAVGIDSPGDEEVAVLDAQVLSDAGRFLGVRLRLRGDGRRTPRVEQLFAVREAPSIDRFLPRVFAESTPEDRFLQRWLAPFQPSAPSRRRLRRSGVM